MSESGYNIPAAIGFEEERETELPIKSVRYRFFKTRRLGLQQFVKRPAPDYASDLLTLEALRKEFLVAYPLSHPNIVRYTFFENNSLYQEFIDGQTLRDMLDSDDERLHDPGFVVSVALQLFNALDYIHAQGLLHLDLKPENLMITRIGNNLKIIDFGCAENAVCDSTSGFTQEFKAPEQGEGATDSTTDIFLAGNVVRELADKARSDRKWARFLRKATAQSASDRYPSAKDALKDIGKISEKKSIFPYAVGAVSGALVIAALFLFFSKSGPEQADTPVAQIPEVITPIEDSLQTSDSAVNVRTPIENAAETMPTSLSETQTPTQPMSAPTAPPEDAALAEERKLAREIENHIHDFYKKNVFTALNDSSSYPEGKNSSEFGRAIHAAIKRGEQDALAFGETLSRKYPDRKPFIESTVVANINAQNSLVIVASHR